jgi:hypothetical protein
LSTILNKSRGEEILKVPLDVAQDLNLPVIVANNQRQEQVANYVDQIDKRLLTFTPQRIKQIEFKEPPKVKRQTTFLFSDDEEEESPKKLRQKDDLKSPPKIRRISPQRPSQEDVYKRAKENYLRDKPLAVSYGKLLAQTSKSQKVSVDSQIGAVEMIVPQSAEDALVLEMGRLRI